MNMIQFLQCIPADNAERLRMLYWKHVNRQVRAGQMPHDPDTWITRRYQDKAARYVQTIDPQYIDEVRSKFSAAVRSAKVSG